MMSVTARVAKVFARHAFPQHYFETIGAAGNSSPIYLTFDDGPHPDRTPKVLDTLAELDVKATFFVLGRNLDKGKHLLNRIVSEGHSLGTHSWSHLPGDKTPHSKWMQDVVHARKKVEDLIGAPCTLFRPPFGYLSPRKLIALVSNGFCIIQWSMDTKDFTCKSRDQLCSWFAQNKPESGTILLMHDNKENTANNLQHALSCWTHQNIRFAPIPITISGKQ